MITNPKSIVLTMSIGAATKMLRLEATHQNITEAIKMVLWDIPTTTSRLLIIEDRGDLADKVLCTVSRDNLFNQLKPFITPTLIEFGPDSKTFQAKAGINPAGELADWLVNNIQ